jgi:hypothetical protein
LAIRPANSTGATAALGPLRPFLKSPRAGTGRVATARASDEGVPFRDFADVVGHQLNLPVVSMPSGGEADAHPGFLGAFVALDNSTSNALTRDLLGWRPVHPCLIPDLEEGHCFIS